MELQNVIKKLKALNVSDEEIMIELRKTGWEGNSLPTEGAIPSPLETEAGARDVPAIKEHRRRVHGKE